MIARNIALLSLVAAWTAPAFAGAKVDDAKLIAEVAAERGAVDSAPIAGELRAAQDEAAVANAKLQLVLARQSLRAKSNLDVVKRAKAALAALESAGVSDRVEELRLQAEGLLSRMRDRGVDVDAIAAFKSSESVTVSEAADAPADSPSDDIRYQAELREATRRQEARRLTEVDEARLAPETEVAYPDDWQARVAGRDDNGQIARGKSWTDGSGKERYVAVYDLNDLTYVAPDFQLNYGFDPYDDLRTALDREALRQRSEIFNGYASDLAAGIPLLPYFGGIGDPFVMRGPKYDARRQEQIVEMIRRFTDESADNVIISLPDGQ
ncbi:MAG: hypothetical protein KDA32_10340 [Phycisphaerales bacterium]|nr:hypothetical protein [Phycisphaerales bacterium]